MSKAQQLITEHIDIWTSAILAKSGVGRGSSKKRELYGIKKLRELILELAVRGKLVPQDPSDEPASVLLEKMAAEKAELIKEGKVKDSKSLSDITKDEVTFELPEGWEWVKFGSFFNSILSGGTPSKGNPIFWGGDIPWASVKDLGKERHIFRTEDYITQEGLEAGSRLADQGDILICTRMGIGKIAIAGNTIAFNQDLKSVKLNSKINIEYFLNSYSTLKIKGTGTTVKGIRQEELLNYIIGLPPLSEQHRIVAKVDELMLLCDQLEQQTEASIDAHATLVNVLLSTLIDSAGADELLQNWARVAEHFDTLFTTDNSIEALKQTILQLAVMGKLVPQNPEDETASVLLEKIVTEKAILIKEKKIKKEKPLPSINDDEKSFMLPEGWAWCRLDSLSLSSEAGWSPQCESYPRDGDAWGVLKVSAVTWGRFNHLENKALPSSLEPRSQYEVKGGDFLISRANTAELVARAVVVPPAPPRNLMMSDKIIRFSFSKEILSNYINLANNSKYSRYYYAAVAGGTSSSMKNVSRNQVRALVIALPPFNEQQRIVDKVDDLMTICDQLKDKLQKSQQTQVHLTDALIDQALI